MGKPTKETIQEWIKDSIKLMLEKNDGAVYYYHIKGGASFILTWVEYTIGSENKFSDGRYTIELSVRKSYSSYFTDDWTYIGEGIALDNSDESNRFTAVVDYFFDIVLNYVKTEIYYILPNKKQIELLSEMYTANCDFGDFEEPIEDLRKTYYETRDEIGLKEIDEKIEAQCLAFANFLSTQYLEIQSMINIDNLSSEIKQAIIG